MSYTFTFRPEAFRGTFFFLLLSACESVNVQMNYVQCREIYLASNLPFGEKSGNTTPSLRPERKRGVVEIIVCVGYFWV